MFLLFLWFLIKALLPSAGRHRKHAVETGNPPGSTSCSWACTRGPSPPPGGAPERSGWPGFRCCSRDNSLCSSLFLSSWETERRTGRRRHHHHHLQLNLTHLHHHQEEKPRNLQILGLFLCLGSGPRSPGAPGRRGRRSPAARSAGGRSPPPDAPPPPPGTPSLCSGGGRATERRRRKRRTESGHASSYSSCENKPAAVVMVTLLHVSLQLSGNTGNALEQLK